MNSTLKTVLKTVASVLVGIVGIGLIYFIYTVVHNWIFLIIPVAIVGISFPFIMRHGIKILNKERDNIYAQLSHNMPVQYNTGRIFRGFVELLFLMWLIPIVPFVVAGDLWVAILPVVTVAILIVESLAANIWSDIGWSKGKFWLMNIGIYILDIVVGVVISDLILP